MLIIGTSQSIHPAQGFDNICYKYQWSVVYYLQFWLEVFWHQPNCYLIFHIYSMTVKSSRAQLVTAFLLAFTNFLENACISDHFWMLLTFGNSKVPHVCHVSCDRNEWWLLTWCVESSDSVAQNLAVYVGHTKTWPHGLIAMEQRPHTIARQHTRMAPTRRGSGGCNIALTHKIQVSRYIWLTNNVLCLNIRLQCCAESVSNFWLSCSLSSFEVTTSSDGH